MNGKLYREFDREHLDAAYNNVLAAGNFTAILERFKQRSRHVYSSKKWIRNLRYGARPRTCYDFLSCGIPLAPTYIFIHGGYWSNGSKEDFAFIADGPLAQGMNVVLAEYTLAPQAKMTEIVAEIGQLIEHLAADRDQLGIAGNALYLSGHSAGGHLTAQYRSHPAISKAHMISALVDLEPVSLCWLQSNLNLTAEEINSYSPLYHVTKGAPTLIAVGASELSELKRHSYEYAAVCEKSGEEFEHILLPALTHFSILEDLANPNGEQMKAFINLA